MTVAYDALEAARGTTVALAISQTSFRQQSSILRRLYSDIEQLHLKVDDLEQALEGKSAELQHLAYELRRPRRDLQVRREPVLPPEAGCGDRKCEVVDAVRRPVGRLLIG